MPDETSTSMPTSTMTPQPTQKRVVPKTGIVLIVIIGLLLMGGGGGVWWWSRQKTAPVSPVTPQTAGPSGVPATLLIWDDSAGFTFKYPEGLRIDKHDEDQENYAHIELTSAAHPGKLIVWAKDLPLTKKGVVVKDVSEWVTSDATYASGNVVDTALGGQLAKKVLLSSPEMLVTGAVHDDVLWMVEGTLTDKTFWSEVHKTIIDSFTFKPLTQIGGAEAADTEVAVDEEEVVE